MDSDQQSSSQESTPPPVVSSAPPTVENPQGKALPDGNLQSPRKKIPFLLLFGVVAFSLLLVGSGAFAFFLFNPSYSSLTSQKALPTIVPKGMEKSLPSISEQRERSSDSAETSTVFR